MTSKENKKPQPKKKSNAGCKGKYKREFCDIIREWKRNRGTNRSFMKKYNISHDAFYRWLRDYDEFNDAYKKGDEESFDELAELAKDSTWKMINGYEYKERKEVIRYDSEGNKEGHEVTIMDKKSQPNVPVTLATMYALHPDRYKRDPSMEDDNKDKSLILKVIKEDAKSIEEVTKIYNDNVQGNG